MAFALWIEDGTAWAAGTHEYRPMGTAVVAATDLFAARDFDPGRRAPSRRRRSFRGLFASLNEVNRYISNSRSQPIPSRLRSGQARQLSTI
jgi:hypothetical protein